MVLFVIIFSSASALLRSSRDWVWPYFPFKRKSLLIWAFNPNREISPASSSMYPWTNNQVHFVFHNHGKQKTRERGEGSLISRPCQESKELWWERVHIPSCSEVSLFFLALGRFVQLEELGLKVVHEQPRNGRTLDVHHSMEKLDKKQKELEKMWEQRRKKLQDALELHKFNREGDRISAALSGHEAFLRGDDLGVCTAADFSPTLFPYPGSSNYFLSEISFLILTVMAF